jgi:two-component system CheB/CheR fusion protein
VVQSIARQTLRNTRTREDFVERFSGRLAALAAAHGLMVQSEWKGADLGALVRVQLEPYASDDGARLRVAGPEVSLPPDYATAFGLVLHELATNAAKYGALSNAGGRLTVSWTLDPRADGRLLTLDWREAGGPPFKRGAKSGLGSTLIDKGIPNAKVQRDFAADGFACRIELPLRERDEG